MSDRNETLWRVVGPTFVAGIVTEIANGERVVAAAPMFKHMMGWTKARMLRHAERRGWEVEELPIRTA